MQARTQSTIFSGAICPRMRLAAACAASGVYACTSVALEEFVEGHEGFLDTITINGHVSHEFASHYFPNVLEAMRTRWSAASADFSASSMD